MFVSCFYRFPFSNYVNIKNIILYLSNLFSLFLLLSFTPLYSQWIFAPANFVLPFLSTCLHQNNVSFCILYIRTVQLSSPQAK